MTLNDSMENISERIREQEKNKRYFYKTILPRFSDCIYDGKIHFAKIFEFFEMARFDIMHQFYDFYQKKQASQERVNLGSFVVVRIQCDNGEKLQEPVAGEILIKTALTVHPKPLLEFEQIAVSSSTGEILTKANIKIAIVDAEFRTVEVWEQEILLAMLEFIFTYGKEDIP